MQRFLLFIALAILISLTLIFAYERLDTPDFVSTAIENVKDAYNTAITNRFAKDTPLDGRETIYVKNIPVSVEIVTSESGRSKGLMHRNSLDIEAGMLFVFPEYGYHSFWMKNTRFSLDIIWLDANHKIVHIEENVVPCTSIDCPTYTPKAPALYVLEVLGGWTKDNNIFVGDPANLNY